MTERRGGVSWIVLGAVIFLMAASARAQSAPSVQESIGLRVFLESTYTHNFGHPDSSTNQLRAFDTEAGSLRLDVAELVVEKKASARGEAGFRVDALAGSSIPRATAASGLFRDTVTGEAKDYDLLQAFASYVAPIGRGLKLDAGKFTTHLGYEAVEGPDGYNDNASRSFLFAWAEPVSHTGLRITYPLNEALSAQAMVVNGWDDVKDNNGAKSVGAQLLYTPTPAVNMAFNVLSGPEKPRNDTDQRHSLNSWIAWKAGKLSLAMTADYGNEEGDRPDGRRAQWYGVAGYARMSLNERFALAIRAETFRDPDGVRTGSTQTLRALTLTPEYKLGKGFILRGDLRHDRSNEAVFERRDGHSNGQTTASLSALYVY
jgi:Putative beta-barrel porin-2, OmpL-like. bbp2